MTTTEKPAADNGVDVPFLLGARTALSDEPAGAQFQWRAETEWVKGTQSRGTVKTFFGLGEEQEHTSTFTFDADHPLQFSSEDHGATPVEILLVALGACLTGGIASVAQLREIQLRSVKATIDGRARHPRHPRRRPGGAQPLQEHQGPLRHRRRRHAGRDRRRGRPVAEALGGLRQPHQPGRGHGRGQLTTSRGRGPVLRVTTVVIGAGHSGLAVSRHLAERGVDHVVLERSEVASSWRSQRWDSLRLLTPNWMSRLPGYAYRGDDPDGYMTAPQVAAFIEGYAKESAAPVQATRRSPPCAAPTTGTSSRPTRRRGGRARSSSPRAGRASPPCPRSATACPRGSSSGRRAGPHRTCPPTAAPPTSRRAGCWWSGPSASGIQIAQEVHASGRPVTLAVGEHVRMPRTYRGLDVLWWMDATGLFDDRYDEIPDLLRARVLPSMQLIGSPERATLDLNTLSHAGIRLVGRLAGVRDGVAQLSGSLPTCARWRTSR